MSEPNHRTGQRLLRAGGPLHGGRRFFGWYVVGAAFCIALFGWGFGFYGLAVYLSQLQSLRGWSVAFIGAAATAYYLFGALLLACYDGAVARLGQRTVVLVGIGAMGASVLSLPFVVSRWQLVGAYLLMAVGWSAMSLTTVTALIAPWFIRRRGFAMSLALNGASCGGIVLAPGMIWLSSNYGFAVAAGICVTAMVVLLTPMTIAWLGHRPEDLGLAPDGDASPPPASAPTTETSRRRLDMLWSITFWSVAAPFAMALMAQVGFITHQVSFLEPRLGAGGAGLALALTTTAAVAGRLALGLVVDRLDPGTTTAACLVSQAMALFAMVTVPTAPVLYAGSLVFGLSVGNLITLPALIVQREFAASDFVGAVALIAATSQIFYAFGPGVLGVVREAVGDYDAALTLCMVLELAAAGILVFRPQPHLIR